MLRRWALFFALSLSLCMPVGAQTGHYIPSSMFSSSLLSGMCQDDYGNIWIATDYGLNRFDGYRFTTFLHNDADSTSLMGNTVVTLMSEKGGNLWVGTNHGLDYYDAATNSFRHCRFPGTIKPRVTDITRLNDGSIMASTAGYGAYRLNKGDGDDYSLTLANEYGVGDADGYYRGLVVDRQGRIWKYGFDKSFAVTQGKRKQAFQSAVGDVVSIVDGGSEVFIVGQNGIMAYDGKSVSTVTALPSKDGVGSESIVFDVAAADDAGTLYLGTRGSGLWKLVKRDAAYRLERVQVATYGIDLNTTKVLNMLFDRKGNLWLGLQNKGLLMIPQQQPQFANWNFSMQNVRLGSNVSSVCEGDGGMTWCTVQGVGVYGFDAQGHLAAHPSAPRAVEFIYRDRQHRYWLGTDDGLYAYDPLSGQSRRMVHFECDMFNDMTTDEQGNLYVSTFSRGFCTYNPQTGELRNHSITNRDSVRGFLCNDWVMCMQSDREGLIWMGTASGVSCYDPKADNFHPHGWHQLLNGTVCFSLCELSDGNVAIGTEQGLYLYNRQTRQVAPYPGSEQLRDKAISYIVQAADGDLWCSTSMGIWQYNRQEKRFIGHVNGNGLNNREYLYGVGLHTQGDRIYFGTNDGLTTFMPGEIKPQQQEADALLLTDFIVEGESVNTRTVLNGVHVTSEAVPLSNKFRLSYRDNTFTMVFSQLNFANPTNVTIEYRINKGPWLHTNFGTNTITLSQLQPGTYHIEVRALANGAYSPTKSIDVTIQAPWYRTTLARVCYALLFLLLLAAAALTYRRRTRRLMDEEKMKFLINATHDIRSPLTLIMGPLAKLKQHLGGGQKEALLDIDTIEHNANRILNLVNQILDVRKIDKQQMHLHCQPTDLVAFTKGVCKMFDYNAEERNINFSFDHDGIRSLEAWIDRNQFDKVLANLLSNAFKYCSDGGTVTVALSATREAARFEVTDDGMGIDSDTLKHIFDRFYQGRNSQNNTSAGTGIGLNLCKMIVDFHHGTIEAHNRTDTHGSRFVVTVPLGYAHLKEEERVTQAPTPPPSTGYQHSVLVVDDDIELASYIASELGRHYRCSVCGNGKEALKELLTNNYDLVVSDVMMPEMDGFTMLRMIKTNMNLLHIPVVMLTSKTDVANRLEGLEQGADGYMNKPFDMNELRATVDSLIRTRQRLKGKFSGAQQQLERVEAPTPKGNDEQLMERLMKVVNAHLDDSNFSVDVLTQEVGISRTQLHRKMKEMTGLSTSEFVRNIRLEQAARLLREQKINVTQVAYAVGFSNLSHFSTLFHRHFGMSPKEFADTKEPRERERPTPEPLP